MKKLLLCLGLCATTCILTSCDNNGSSSRTRGRLHVEEKGDSIEVRGPDGTILIKGNQKKASLLMKTDNANEASINQSTETLAPNFPSDIPVLPDCIVTMNQVFQNGRNAIATLSTNKKPDEVILFFEEQIPLKGWEPGDRFDLDNIVMLNGKQGTASLNISITAKNETTIINIARTESTE